MTKNCYVLLRNPHAAPLLEHCLSSFHFLLLYGLFLCMLSQYAFFILFLFSAHEMLFMMLNIMSFMMPYHNYFRMCFNWISAPWLSATNRTWIFNAFFWTPAVQWSATIGAFSLLVFPFPDVADNTIELMMQNRRYCFLTIKPSVDQRSIKPTIWFQRFNSVVKLM